MGRHPGGGVQPLGPVAFQEWAVRRLEERVELHGVVAQLGEL